MGAASVTAGQRITASLINDLPVSIPLVTGSISNSVAETLIGTFSIPANDSAAAVGSGYRALIFGSADDTGAPTLTLRMRFNSAAGATYGGVSMTCRTSTAGMTYGIDTWFYYTAAGAAGTFNAFGVMSEAVTSGSWAIHPMISGVSIGTVDTTAPVTFAISAQWGTASTSNIARTLSGGLYRI